MESIAKFDPKTDFGKSFDEVFGVPEPEFSLDDTPNVDASTEVLDKLKEVLGVKAEPPGVLAELKIGDKSFQMTSTNIDKFITYLTSLKEKYSGDQ